MHIVTVGQTRPAKRAAASRLATDAPDVRHEVARLDLLGQLRPGDHRDAPAAGQPDNQSSHVHERRTDAAAHVVETCVAFSGLAKPEQSLHRVVDVDVVPQLASVAVDRQSRVGQRQVNEAIDHAVGRSSARLAGAVGIREPADSEAQSV